MCLKGVVNKVKEVSIHDKPFIIISFLRELDLYTDA